MTVSCREHNESYAAKERKHRAGKAAEEGAHALLNRLFLSLPVEIAAMQVNGEGKHTGKQGEHRRDNQHPYKLRESGFHR